MMPKQRRARRLRRLTWIVLVLAAALGAGCARQGTPATQYTCPMHPQYVADRPGDCPICNMRLVPRTRADSTHADPPPHAAAGSGAAVPGYAGVELDPDMQRLAGVQTAAATHERLARSIRTVGIVAADESRLLHVHTKIGGYIEHLHVTATGQYVRAGQPAFALYSPELLATQEEFLQARRALTGLPAAAGDDARRAAQDLLAAARQRLSLLDVPDAFVAFLEATGTAQRMVTFPVPGSGYVTAKNVIEGEQVEAGTELFTITDLSRVWVEANFYENDATLVQTGQNALLTLPYEGGVQLAGKVTYVYPYLDPGTRTLKVRFEFQNPDLRLKPAMYVDVQLDVESADGVVIPESAVLDSGERQIVFVETAAGRFEPRVVRIGLRGEGRVQVLAGLTGGEKVVIRANFLLDSESRLRGAWSAADTPAHAAPPGAAPPAPAPPAHVHGGRP